MTGHILLAQVIGIAALTGASVIMGWRKPPMVSLAYVVRALLASAWAACVFAVAAFAALFEAAGQWPKLQHLRQFAPTVLLIALLTVVFIAAFQVLKLIFKRTGKGRLSGWIKCRG